MIGNIKSWLWSKSIIKSKSKIKRYFQNEHRFNGVYLRNNIRYKKDGAYVINLDEYANTGTYWIALYINIDNVTYFDSFGVEHIFREMIKFIGNKNNVSNTFRIQAYDSIMCEIFGLDLLIICLWVKA